MSVTNLPFFWFFTSHFRIYTVCCLNKINLHSFYFFVIYVKGEWKVTTQFLKSRSYKSTRYIIIKSLCFRMWAQLTFQPDCNNEKLCTKANWTTTILEAMQKACAHSMTPLRTQDLSNHITACSTACTVQIDVCVKLDLTLEDLTKLNETFKINLTAGNLFFLWPFVYIILNYLVLLVLWFLTLCTNQW